jgi:hypothetical protein
MIDLMEILDQSEFQLILEIEAFELLIETVELIKVLQKKQMKIMIY